MIEFDLITGDALELLRKADDRQVRCCVTSPPYYGLRDYGTGQWEGGDPVCKHRFANPQRMSASDGTFAEDRSAQKKVESARPMLQQCRWCGANRVDEQIGLEASVELYVQRLVEVFREVRRVMTDDGTLWLNIGDSYITRPGQGTRGKATKQSSTLSGGVGNDAGYTDRDPKQKDGLVRASGRPNRGGEAQGLKHKDLIGVPWRLAFALQADGWWLRHDIIWCLSGGVWLYAQTQKHEAPAMLKDLVKLRPETVKLWNGSKWTQVVSWTKSRDVGEKIELVLRSGERVGCTGRHLWPTQRGNVPASELVVGDVIQACRLPEPQGARRPGYLTDDAVWLAGLFLAEGSWADDTIQLSLNADELGWLPRIQRVADHLGGSMTHTVDGNKLAVRLYGKMLVALMESFVLGRLSEGVRVRADVWSLPDSDLRLFAEGYLDGDGSWESHNNRWRLGFARNYALERDLRVLAARVGAKLKLSPCVVTSQTGKHAAFRGEWRWERSGHANEKDSGEVVEIRRSRAREFWDVEVADEPHLFALASGILTHNSKPNPLPESVRDRPTRAHEYVFLFSKSKDYFYDYESMKEPVTGTAKPRGKGVHPKAGKNESAGEAHTGTRSRRIDGFNARWNVRSNSSFCAAVTELVETRNRRDVWRIASEPYKGSHYAVMPTKLVEPCVLAGSAPGDLVLDPFFGSGTVGVVALRHGRNFVGLDLDPKNVPLAQERIFKELASQRKESA